MVIGDTEQLSQAKQTSYPSIVYIYVYTPVQTAFNFELRLPKNVKAVLELRLAGTKVQ